MTYYDNDIDLSQMTKEELEIYMLSIVEDMNQTLDKIIEENKEQE